MLPVAEKLKGQYGRVVFILAGYQKHMDDLFEHNPGLPSRFPRHFIFEDYTEDELLSILTGHIANPNGVRKPQKKATAPQASNGPVVEGYVAFDKWDKAWTFKGGRQIWKGENDIECGRGPLDANHPLGTQSNPVYARSQADNNKLLSWVYNETTNLWSTSSSGSKSEQRKEYPGQPDDEHPRPPFHLSDPKWGRIAARRLSRMRGKVGFGNARAVRNLFELAMRRQAERISRERDKGQDPNIYELRRDDLLGPRADAEKLESCEALKELHKMEGLVKVS